jgi:hypothetical protein
MDTPAGSSANGASPHSGPAPEVSAEWVLQQHNAQQEVNARLAADNARILALLQSLAGNEQRTAPSAPQETAATTMTTIAPVATVSSTQIPKQRMGRIHPYTDEDKSLYPQYKGLLEAKLDIDALALGTDDKERAWWAFGTLQGDAAKRIYPWVSLAKKTDTLTTVALLEQMDQAFSDPEEQTKALRSLNRMKQGKDDLRLYIGKFEEALLKAGGWTWEENVKKSMFFRGVNRTIKDRMVGKDEPATYSKLVAMVRKISDDLQALNIDNGVWRPFNSKSHDSGSTSKPQASSESMDWEPTSRAAANKPPRKGDKRTPAKWASKDVLEQRRADGVCLRCGGDDHFIDKCRYGPAKRPSRSTSSVGSSSSQRTTKSAGKSSTKSKKPAPHPKVEEVETDSGDESPEDVDSENE